MVGYKDASDTLASFEKLSVTFNPYDLIKKNLKISRLILSDGSFNFITEGANKENNLARIFNLKGGKAISLPDMYVADLRLHNFRFRYYNPYSRPKKKDPHCIDFSDMDISNINIKINRIKTLSGILTCRIQQLSCLDKSGLLLTNLKGDFTMGPHESRLDNMRLISMGSDIKAKYLSFRYDSGKDLKDFVNKIVMSADFTNARLDFRTLGKITPSLKNSLLQIDILGEVIGPVCHLSTSDLTLTSPSGKTKIRLATLIEGLPEAKNMRFTLNLKDLRTRTPELSEMIASYSGSRPNKTISTISPKTDFHYSGVISGMLSDLSAKGKITSSIGSLSHNVKMLNTSRQDGVRLSGDISTDNLEIGNILNNKTFGKVSMSTSLTARLRKEQYGGNEVQIDSLVLDKLGLMGYEYSNILLAAKMVGKMIDAKVICHDPNLDFIFQGLASLPDDNAQSRYNFYINIPYADLHKLNIDKKSSVSKISLATAADFSLKNKSNLLGDIDIKNLDYTNSNGSYSVNAITLHSVIEDSLYIAKLDSPFLKADYTSTGDPGKSMSKIMQILLYDQFPNIFPDKKVSSSHSLSQQECHLDLLTLNMKPICNILSPGFYVADSTSISLNLTDKDSLNFLLKSDRIALKNNYIKDLNISLSNPDSLLKCDIVSSIFNAAGIHLDDNKMSLVSENGIIDFNYLFANKGETKNELQFSSTIFFERDSVKNLVTNLHINESDLYFQNQKWTFDPCHISIGKKNYIFDSFRLFNNKQEIIINGAISTRQNEELKVKMNDFDLSIVNSIVKNDFNIKGLFTGNVTVMNLFSSPGLLMDLKGKNVFLFDNEVDDLSIMSKYDLTNKRFNLLINNKFHDKNPLNIVGYYQPDRKYINLNLTLEDFALTYIDPFLEDILRVNDGSISGDISILGPIDKLVMMSNNTRFNNLSFTPVYTNVQYILDGPISLSESGISLNRLVVHDQYKNEAVLSGNIQHRFFKNMYLDTKLVFNNLQCLNTLESSDKSFYGTAFGSGEVSVTGPLNDILIEALIKTGEKTSIHVPLSSSSSASRKELITFKQADVVFADPYDEMMYTAQTQPKKKKSKLELKAKANITSDAEVLVEINKQVGDVLKCRGKGVIDLDINPSQNLTDLRGDYTISDGSYKFVVLGVLAKDFTLNEGGMIAFNGPVKNTTLNVGANYQTKASVSTLISDTSSVGNRRNVNCGINLSGPINNPQISFSIDIPDLDPITKGRTESALSTPDKVQKQFMALLISGSFVPDEQSGIVNNTTLLYSNAGEILSNQFNNIFRQLDIPLDLGLNYQKSQGKKDMFDVALSYQAFNNRVVINGNVGNSQTSSNWMGNFNAEVKIDKKGKFRVSLFTRSADDYSNYLDNTQRSGLGFTFQDEFDSIGELFRSIFMSKKKREDYENEQMLKTEAELLKETEKLNIKKEEVQGPKEDPMKLNNEAGLGQYRQ